MFLNPFLPPPCPTAGTAAGLAPEIRATTPTSPPPTSTTAAKPARTRPGGQRVKEQLKAASWPVPDLGDSCLEDLSFQLCDPLLHFAAAVECAIVIPFEAYGVVETVLFLEVLVGLFGYVQLHLD
jgi:hypothetical protein